MKFNLLECTLRDGGYQVNWDFDEDFVKDYLELCSSLKLKNIEFGFRFFDNLVRKLARAAIISLRLKEAPVVWHIFLNGESVTPDIGANIIGCSISNLPILI